MAHLHFLGKSKHRLQCELDLARIDSCAGDDAIVGLTQLSAGRTPDRMIRQIEGLRSKFHVFRLADRLRAIALALRGPPLQLAHLAGAIIFVMRPTLVSPAYRLSCLSKTH